ncbi:Bug family tripartite tricarboxylate transporter substrate binding protein [Pseudorhodoplanes sp.]|uniref:Bug family tripartite tricarboxylate transporter substrate binding protein n=1 Tax=Pseudorhodoplanes sp. TaxID=1934341 RepID=UPI003D1156D0
MTGHLLRAAFIAATLSNASVAIAQDYPNRPVRIIVPFAAGGSADLTIRSVSLRLTEKLGKPFVIESRPGAGGQAGIEFALSAQNDGYTLISTPSGAVSIVPNLRKVQFDPASDLEPVAMLAKVPVGIAVNGNLPIKSIAELIEYSKTQPKGINYSVAAVGTHMHLAGEIFKGQTGSRMQAVPYKGTGPAAAAVYAGEVEATVSDLATLLPLAHDNKVRILAVLDRERTAVAPDIPSIGELGVSGAAVGAWIGVFVRKGTERGIVDKLSSEIGVALNDPEIKSLYAKAGLEVWPLNSSEMKNFINTDLAWWREAVSKVSLKIQ